MNPNPPSVQRVVGLDVHPDSFTAAIVVGPTPLAAIVQGTFNKIPISQLVSWAKKHTLASDIIVLEASGNSFHVAKLLRAQGRDARVLESIQLGKLKEAHANNDRISAIRIAKAFLSGTCKAVWIPDPATQERRDWFHAHAKASRELTRLNNVLLSYLSDNGVRLDQRLKDGTREEAAETIRSAGVWSARQWQVIEILLLDVFHAQESLRRWESLIAQEVCRDPLLLSLVRLTGVRDVVAFALGAVIGDVGRFEKPKKLVKYVGLDPVFDDSGEGHWSGGIGGHGHKQMRGLLIEAAHSIMRSKHPMAAWGKRLLARKGEIKLVVAALARKLLVAAWYLMKGLWDEVKDIPENLDLKLGKIITRVGKEGLGRLGVSRRELRGQMHETLRTGRTYVLDRDRTYRPDPPPAAPAVAGAAAA